jgi:hypothetical protein
MKSVNSDRTTPSRPTSLLQSIHLAPAPSAAADNDESHRHVEKQILPDLKKRRENHAADLKDRQAHIVINSETPP